MTEESMVERATRAAYEKMRARLLSHGMPEYSMVTWENMTGVCREDWIESQRAAIACMRQPTEAMMAAAGGDKPYQRFLAKVLWEFQIDASLKETP